MLKPFIKWAGGKRQLLPVIRRFLPPDIERRVYYEPFTGAGALFFDLLPRRALISDLNSELILTYRVIRDQVGALIAALAEHAARHCKEYYYEVRSRSLPASVFSDEGGRVSGPFPPETAVIVPPPCARNALRATPAMAEQAARFIYLNKTCYNGLYRVNSRGGFNVPLGRHKTITICEDKLLREISRYLNAADITILNADFQEAVYGIEQNAFVYFDPPYHSVKKNGFKNYQAGGFGEEEQIRLRDVFLDLTRRGIPCVLSNADTPFVRELYCNGVFHITAVSARRAINSDSSGRGAANEVLVTNW